MIESHQKEVFRSVLVFGAALLVSSIAGFLWQATNIIAYDVALVVASVYLAGAFLYGSAQLAMAKGRTPMWAVLSPTVIGLIALFFVPDLSRADS